MRITLATPALISDNPAEPLSLPLGIAYLGSSLMAAGHEVSLIDGVIEGGAENQGADHYRIGLSPGGLANRIRESKPDLIGMSCPFTPRYKLFHETVARVRKTCHDIPVIAGGMHPTLFAEKMLIQDKLDGVVVGEGEDTLVELVRRYEDTGRLEWEGLDGVAYLNGGEPLVKPRVCYIEDLDRLPLPARDRLPVERYLRRSGGRWSSPCHSSLSILTSRSCPGRCSFCSVHAVFGPRWRGRSPAKVLDEIAQILSDYSPSLIAIEDDRFTWERQRVLDICRGIRERGLRFRWFTPNGVHVDDLDEEVLGEMRASGCKSLNLAVESGDEVLLREVIGKKATPKQALAVAEICRGLGIKINGYFVIGMPGETDRTVAKSLQLCLDMKLDGLGVFIATPFPGTRFYQDCLNKGYVDSAERMDEALESGDPGLLHQPVFSTPTMSRERLGEWQREFNRRYLDDLYRRKPALRLRNLTRSLMTAVRH